MEPLISVIIPIYNVEAYLRRCVDGILNQSYKNLEIILVDDESPDHCPQICDEYAKMDERVRVIHQKNAGLSGARNAGIEIAKGSYIAFVDSDDYVSESFIEELYYAILSTGSDLAQCKWKYVKGEQDVAYHDTDTGRISCYNAAEMMDNLYIPDGAYFVVAWNKLYKKELFDQIRYPLGRIHEDEATTYLIYDQIKKAAVLDKCMYGYFTGNASITRGNFNKKRLDWVTAVEERIHFFEKRPEYEETLPKAYKAFADGCIDLYFKCKKNYPRETELLSALKKHVSYCMFSCIKKGKTPLRTIVGYGMFLVIPGVYRRLLNY